MAIKFKLKANPTFKADVDIPVPGAAPTAIPFEFKHFSKSAWDDYLKEHKDIKVRESIFDIAIGWDIDGEPFSREALDMMMDEYPGAESAIWNKFHAERFGVREKN